MLILVKLLCMLIKKNNYGYDTAINGLEALQAFQNAQRPYDIVLMGKETHYTTGHSVLTSE